MSRRTALLGLDGATFDVLDALMADGAMPFLNRFGKRGVRATLRSTVPALTPPAWTSLVTGRSPGAHGIFDFFRKDSPAGLHFQMLTSRDVACASIWNMADQAGLRSTVLNFPLTFPAPHIQGHIVPGGFMPWRQLRLGCHPAGIFDRLRALPSFNPRELALDMTHEAKAIEGCADDEYEPWIDMHIRRERQWVDIALYLHESEPADLLALLFDGVDKIQHLCWRFIDPGLAATLTSPWERRVREKCIEYFRELDGQLERLAGALGDDTSIVIASDHGFGPQVRTLFVNSWLERGGHLAWRDGQAPASTGASALGLNQLARHVYQLDWSRTRAFAPLPSGNGIHILKQSPEFPAGVTDSEYPAFRSRLASELRALRDPDTGEAVVTHVWPREDVFAGPQLELAPDLTLELADGGLVSILASAEAVRRRPLVSGTHRPDGVLMAAGRGIAQGVRLEPMAIVDVAPLLLHALDLDIPASLEGRFIAEALNTDALMARPPRLSYADAPMPAAVSGASLDADAEAEIMKRLQALGYLE